MWTRCNVRVAALSWEEGQGRAAGRRESLAQGGRVRWGLMVELCRRGADGRDRLLGPFASSRALAFLTTGLRAIRYGGDRTATEMGPKHCASSKVPRSGVRQNRLSS